ncbi:MAG: hypothetical protein IPK97_07910 [Ahniella sp.]|nr:hypothetical protein [Ahniella sp.]
MTYQKFSAVLFALAAAFSAPVVLAADAVSKEEPITIDNARGVDSTLDYNSLLKLGPWDDRNYNLRSSDLSVIPNIDKDRYLHGVPAFFKIQKRREMAEQGFPLDRYYPRETNKEFAHRYGGLLQNGVLKRRGLGIYSHPDPANPPPPIAFATDPVYNAMVQKAVPIIGERPFDGTASDNETSVEYHPFNPLILVAGSNGTGGQRMSRSLDGGLTWTNTGALPATCCDPAMDWIPNGANSLVLSATLGTTGGLSTQVYCSEDNGASWGQVRTVSTASADKEFIHVDRHPGSPFFGRIYVTWHQGNVMQFARSNEPAGTPFTTCAAINYATTVSLTAEERGIGSDITTDHAGRVYYFWPSVTNGSAEMRVLRSDDGGVSFVDLNGAAAGLSNQAYDLCGDFDFSIPSMETRRAFIYAAADADRSGGPRNGRIYVAMTDESTASTTCGGAAGIHGWVRVAFSDDQGATWQATTPHPINDLATVDRYHPWLDVDDFGNVHVGFYDTRNSGAGLRDKVDWYYVYSPDGGTTWIEETRVSAGTSQNITDGQEWGDYNGLSVAAGNGTVGMTWTDNRLVGPTATQRSFFGDVQNIGAGPTYVMSGGASTAVCAGSPVTPQNFTLTALAGFSGSVTLSTPGLNAAVFPSAVFAPNPVTPIAAPGAPTQLSLTTAGGATPGVYPVTVSATNGGGSPIVRTATFNVTVASGTPGAPSLTAPADLATGVSTAPTFTWAAVSGATSYTIQVATDSGFTNIIATGNPTTTSFTPAVLLTANTTYFWRVQAVSPCGTGAFTAVRSFTTANQICVLPNVSIPDNNATGVNAPIVIPGPAGLINDLNVKVRLTHTWVGDLEIRLTRTPTAGAPTTVNLGLRVGGTGCQTDNMDTTFDDEASTGVGACAPSYTGSFIPTQALSGFDTQDLGATWTLNVADRAGQDTGNLLEFCLIPSVTPAGPDANLAVAIAGPASQVQGQPIAYTVTVTNAGPDAATSFTLADVVPADITGVTVNCVGNGSAMCGTNGTTGNNVSFTSNSIASGGANSLVYTINGTVNPAFSGNLANTAAVSAVLPGDITTANNSATHNVNVTVSTTAIFQDGFE